ncbi:MAG TPA: hypothetical protein DEQ32_15635 [Gammaproteobacteria bacterium]|nr:hypothetical protein [Gammaproteobacteria bacterium]
MRTIFRCISFSVCSEGPDLLFLLACFTGAFLVDTVFFFDTGFFLAAAFFLAAGFFLAATAFLAAAFFAGFFAKELLPLV